MYRSNKMRLMVYDFRTSRKYTSKYLPHHSVADAGKGPTSNSFLWVTLEAMDNSKETKACAGRGSLTLSE